MPLIFFQIAFRPDIVEATKGRRRCILFKWSPLSNCCFASIVEAVWGRVEVYTEFPALLLQIDFLAEIM